MYVFYSYWNCLNIMFAKRTMLIVPVHMCLDAFCVCCNFTRYVHNVFYSFKKTWKMQKQNKKRRILGVYVFHHTVHAYMHALIHVIKYTLYVQPPSVAWYTVYNTMVYYRGMVWDYANVFVKIWNKNILLFCLW